MTSAEPRRESPGARPSRCGFLAISTAAAEHHNAITSLSAAIEWCLRREAHRSRRWRLEFKRGRDVEVAGSAAICNSVRHEMVHHVDFAAALVYRPSSGCGRVVGWACELGIPTVVLTPSGFDTSPLVGSCADTEGAVSQITFDGYSLPDSDLLAWWRANEQKIADSQARRQRRVREMGPLREACVAQWNSRSDAERNRVAAAMRRDREAVRNLLKDPVEFAWASADLQGEVAELLGVRPLVDGSRDTLEAQLSEGALAAFHQAIDEYRWDAHSSTQVLLAGIAYEQTRQREMAVGLKLRRPALTSRAAWRKVYNSLDLSARAS